MKKLCLVAALLLAGCTTPEASPPSPTPAPQPAPEPEPTPDPVPVPEPTPEPPPAPKRPIGNVGSMVKATQACQSLMNPADVLTVGGSYRITGFGGFLSEPGTNVPEGTRDVIIADGFDDKHSGDGWFSFWVPATCFEGE